MHKYTNKNYIKIKSLHGRCVGGPVPGRRDPANLGAQRRYWLKNFQIPETNQTPTESKADHISAKKGRVWKEKTHLVIAIHVGADCIQKKTTLDAPLNPKPRGKWRRLHGSQYLPKHETQKCEG